MELRRKYLEGEPIHTVYLGGGTPSLLRQEELTRILESVQRCFHPEPNAEISLEANPDDMEEAAMDGWRRVGVNRLSIGVQSFQDGDLLAMNRVHDAARALRAIRSAREHGFSNFSIDLIYGSPWLSREDWRRNLDLAISLQIPHLSCYALTLEEQTPLAYRVRAGRLPAPDPDEQAEQFLLLMERLEHAGYEHYEISNFALPGYRSQHNSAYWRAEPYLGLGPSAHSFRGRMRQWNVSHNAQYIRSLESGILPSEQEELSDTQRRNEYIMTSLRTIEGLNLERFRQESGPGPEGELWKRSGPFLESGKMEKREQSLVLTREGRLFADGIASALFFD